MKSCLSFAHTAMLLKELVVVNSIRKINEEGETSKSNNQEPAQVNVKDLIVLANRYQKVYSSVDNVRTKVGNKDQNKEIMILKESSLKEIEFVDATQLSNIEDGLIITQKGTEDFLKKSRANMVEKNNEDYLTESNEEQDFQLAISKSR
ncbi:unnamed protein product [Vicia faba]|uniref:Uncharacterized protein n=1 Tax=Vicia faba TaxID=3906 RepID=A0AAV1B9V4_VICFA|nr:unnamed protein product [Vicia faba]